MAHKTTVKLSTPEVEDKFKEKMGSLALKEREREIEARASSLGLPYLNLASFPLGQDALRFIPDDEAKRLQLVPLLVTDAEVRLGVVDPDATGLRAYLEELAKRIHARYVLYLISPHSFELALQIYAGMPKLRPISTGVNITEDELSRYQGLMKDFAHVNELMTRASITEIVSITIAGALELRASDIHVEAEEKSIKVRYRIDGALYNVAELAYGLWPKLISRLKLLSHLKLNIEHEPQDGRFTIFLKGDKIDVRVSTIPTSYGESVVMRLLRSSATGLQFEQLGLRGKAYDDLKREVRRPNGMIMATGPTGCGKTTTLYAILNNLNDSKTKIITLEDPVEYKLAGINQSQVDHNAGYDFARGLKAILRQDPDIVMVGEIRDTETTDTAINAALTGHLVISTLHTNSASGAIPRFMAMGAKPFLLAPALNSIIGQRLVRKICEKCKEEIKVTGDVLARVKQVLASISKASGVNLEAYDKLTFYHGKGCDACGGIGYRGRVGLYEVMTMNPDIEKLIFGNKVTESELQDIGIKNGMVTMVQDGILKALDGITSVDEVFRVAE